MLLAVFFDPGSDGVDILDTVAILTVLSLLYWAWTYLLRPVCRWCSARVSMAAQRWVCAAVEPLIDNKLAHYTYPIQRNANGGLSLPDVSKKLDRVLAAMGITDEGEPA